MTKTEADDNLKKRPMLYMNGGVTPLYAYRIDSDGIYFVQNYVEQSKLVESEFMFEPGEQLNYTSRYVLLNSVGKTYRVGVIDQLLAANVAIAEAE